jgi:hypothetical protein
MNKWLSVMLAAALLLYPFAGIAQDYGPQTSQKQQAPPVAQTLVREGDFAIKLAAELDLGKPENEALAEDMLARAGVSPLNGWISDYPMTPEIVGQLGDSIAAAAGEGKLPMTAGEGTRGLYSLALRMNLPTPAGSGAGTMPEAPTNPTVVNNYYYDQGPPVVSYYPPPADYVYLYDWVPYPVFWFGFWFPGFYICHNFTTTVIVSNPVFVGRRAIVTNRIIDPVTRRVTVVDPVVRTSTGTVRPVTALRSGSGQLFRTAIDMRRGVTMSGVSPARTGTAFTGSAARTGGFRTAESRREAQAIYSRSVQGMSNRKGSERAMPRSSGAHKSAPGNAGRSYHAPSRGSEGSRAAPSSSSRSYNSPVIRDVGGYGRSYGTPQRSYNGSMIRGSGGAARSYRGTAWRERM